MTGPGAFCLLIGMAAVALGAVIAVALWDLWQDRKKNRRGKTPHAV
jgi:hypothetical protein